MRRYQFSISYSIIARKHATSTRQNIIVQQSTLKPGKEATTDEGTQPTTRILESHSLPVVLLCTGDGWRCYTKNCHGLIPIHGQLARKLAPILSMTSLKEFGSRKRYRWRVACLKQLRLQTFVGDGVVRSFFDSRDHADSRARTMTSMPLNYGSVRETPAIHDADFEDVPRYPSLSTHESKATPGTPQTAANFFRPRIRFAKQFLGSSGCHNHRIPKLSFLAVLRVGWDGVVGRSTAQAHAAKQGKEATACLIGLRATCTVWLGN